MPHFKTIMNTALCGKAPEWLVQAFLGQNIKLICLGSCNALSGPVRGHIDLMTAKIGKQFFVAPETEKLFSGILPRPPIRIREHLGSRYPEDVKLSALQAGSYLLCRKDSVSEDVKELALQQGIEIIDVKQGYVCCSVCVCNETTVITDDSSIAKALRDHTSLHFLEVEKGSVELPGYPYGFIGGASGKVGNTLYFFGNLQRHPQANDIQYFLKENNISFQSLSGNHPLTDIGGILSL